MMGPPSDESQIDQHILWTARSRVYSRKISLGFQNNAHILIFKMCYSLHCYKQNLCRFGGVKGDREKISQTATFF